MARKNRSKIERAATRGTSEDKDLIFAELIEDPTSIYHQIEAAQRFKVRMARAGNPTVHVFTRPFRPEAETYEDFVERIISIEMRETYRQSKAIVGVPELETYLNSGKDDYWNDIPFELLERLRLTRIEKAQQTASEVECEQIQKICTEELERLRLALVVCTDEHKRDEICALMEYYSSIDLPTIIADHLMVFSSQMKSLIEIRYPHLKNKNRTLD